jgi:hypothetical protein
MNQAPTRELTNEELVLEERAGKFAEELVELLKLNFDGDPDLKPLFIDAFNSGLTKAEIKALCGEIFYEPNENYKQVWRIMLSKHNVVLKKVDISQVLRNNF